MRLHPGRSCTLIAALFLATCATPPSENSTDPQTESTTIDEPSEATEAQDSEGPVEHRISPDKALAPIQSDGIVAIEVPAEISEPQATYHVSPEASRDEFEAIDKPTTADPSNKGKGMPVENVEESEMPEEDPPSGLPGPLAPVLGPTFDAADFDDNGSLTGSLFIPPDPIAAAGPDHLVNVVNVLIEFYQKDGTLDFRDSLQNFFASLSPQTFTFDPKVIYDQYADRFVVITLEQTTGPPRTSRILVAVSDDANPNGAWFFVALNSLLSIGNRPHWADYPGLAIDEEAVYITANMFSFVGNSYGVRLWSLDKGLGSGGLYDGGTVSGTLEDPYGGGGLATTTQPAHIFGTAPPGTGTFLVSYSGLTNSSTGVEAVQVIRVDDPLGSPAFTQQFISIGDIEDFSSFPDAPQSGTGNLIETNDRRALHAVWRDDSLWMTATISAEDGTPASDETFATWWQIDTGNLASLTLADQGIIDGEDLGAGTFTFFPSVAVTSAGDVGFGFSASGPSIFPGSYYTTRKPSDPAGTNTGSETLHAGTDWYLRTFSGSRNRWGDYSGIAVDPQDECFWVYNEHAITRGTPTSGQEGRWGTAYGNFCVCDQSFDLAAGEWKQITLACDQGASPTVEDVFGDDLGTGSYGGTWGMYAWDPASSTYSFMALTDPLSIGTGYWIGTQIAAQTVDVKGIANSTIEVPLTSDPAGRFNQVGHPFDFDVCWADVEVIDSDDTVLSLSQADPINACQGPDPLLNGCVMSRIAYKWNGASYDSFDGITAGSEGTLVPLDGFWTKAYKDGIKLRVPASPGNCGAPAIQLTTVETALASTSTARRGRPASAPQQPWHIRLIATSGWMHDAGAVLGRAQDSLPGYDSHDLPELSPFGVNYLAVVFPHPNWTDRPGDYATDFRSLSSAVKREIWLFEVRTSAVGEEVTLTWDGPEDRLKKAMLVDRVTRRPIRPRAGEGYTYTADSESREFLWMQRP